MIKIALHWQILVAILLGIAVGFFFPQYTGYVLWMGTLFLRLLKMVVIPLVFCALVSAMTGSRGEGKLGMGGKGAGLFVLTTLAAILTGLFFVNIFQPGVGIILHTVGLPPEAIGLVIAVDRPLDMCRTVLNVYGDTCCAAVIAKTEGETLRI